jgi:hypothetical protein
MTKNIAAVGAVAAVGWTMHHYGTDLSRHFRDYIDHLAQQTSTPGLSDWWEARHADEERAWSYRDDGDWFGESEY